VGGVGRGGMMMTLGCVHSIVHSVCHVGRQVAMM
jgi:hypothetical protein